MDKYQKMLTGLLIGGVSIALIFIIIVFNGAGTGGSGSEDTSFPFFIFFPSWVAIFVPLLARQRQEAKKNEEELKNQLEE